MSLKKDKTDLYKALEEVCNVTGEEVPIRGNTATRKKLISALNKASKDLVDTDYDPSQDFRKAYVGVCKKTVETMERFGVTHPWLDMDEEDEKPKKKRGRPKKNQEEEEAPKRKRGRPKKVEIEEEEEEEAPKKKRGRPKKNQDDDEDPPKRKKRGRPKKNQDDDEDENEPKQRRLENNVYKRSHSIVDAWKDMGSQKLEVSLEELATEANDIYVNNGKKDKLSESISLTKKFLEFMQALGIIKSITP